MYWNIIRCLSYIYHKDKDRGDAHFEECLDMKSKPVDCLTHFKHIWVGDCSDAGFESKIRRKPYIFGTDTQAVWLGKQKLREHEVTVSLHIFQFRPIAVCDFILLLSPVYLVYLLRSFSQKKLKNLTHPLHVVNRSLESLLITSFWVSLCTVCVCAFLMSVQFFLVVTFQRKTELKMVFIAAIQRSLTDPRWSPLDDVLKGLYEWWQVCLVIG